MLVDSHSHLFLEEFAEDLPQVIKRAQDAGVTHIFMPNIDSTTIEPLLSVCASYKGLCFPMIGLHPTSVNESYKQELDIVFQQLTAPNDFVAIGEIGLDYHWDVQPHEVQQHWFVQQMDLAKELDLPIAVHSRDAAKDTFDLIAARGKNQRGVIHCYSYSPEMAQEYVKLGYHIGLGGVVTFKNAKKAKETARQIPLERILLETDCPYMAPTPFRGKRNNSAYIDYVAQEIADLKGISKEEVIAVTEENARKLFLSK